jgi:hypothetical protein
VPLAWSLAILLNLNPWRLEGERICDLIPIQPALGCVAFVQHNKLYKAF